MLNYSVAELRLNKKLCENLINLLFENLINRRSLRLLIIIIRKRNLQDAGDGRSHLLGIDGSATFHFSQIQDVFSESHQPGLIAALNSSAMFRPGSFGINFATVGVNSQAFSPAMIAGDKKGGVALVKWVLLAAFP